MASMITSKLTERLQTTLPPAVRTVLGLGPGERLGYIIEGNEVKLVNASAIDQEDAVLNSFLDFIARDLKTNPEHIQPFPQSLLDRARELTTDIPIDHDAPIDGDTAL